jgi:UDP-2,3-diacylglucosamine pyrophosphatase LpxH
MLVIISDLHFCDDTAYARKIEAPAFAMLMDEVGDLAVDCGAECVDLVLLGDVFDLLRTTAWFREGEQEVPLSQRPWGSTEALDRRPASPDVLERARRILEAIERVNRPSLRALRAECVEAVGKDGKTHRVPVRRHYMPGNHDRLCLHDEGLLERMLGLLGAKPVGPDLHPASELHALVHPDYGLVARHGHEWDPWNFERYEKGKLPAQYSPADFLPAPIGDAITTELVAALPYRVRSKLEASGEFAPTARDPTGPERLDALVARLQSIEDVRPTIAAFCWAAYETGRLQQQLRGAHPRRADALMRALNETVHELATGFLQMPYYREWRARHGWLGNWANRFHALLELLQVADLSRVSDFLERLEKIGSWLEGVVEHEDSLLAGAKREDLRAAGSEGLRYLVYGHTHKALQVALRADATQDIYLNSGTWRGRQFATMEGSGFVGWEQCTWLTFYKKDEPKGSGRTGPAFESWTGQRKVRDHGQP